MLIFSTVLSIKKNVTKDDFIKLVIEWNQGSPHASNIIPNIVWNGEYTVRYESERLWLDIKEYRNKNIIAVRFEKCDVDGVVWDSDYIMNFNDMKMAVRLDRSYTADAQIMNSEFSAPYFISLLIDRGYLEEDENLPVISTPCFIKEDMIGILADIINGKKYRLPVVFVSKTFANTDPLDVYKLAYRLKGVAHVLVQENNVSTNSIKEVCNEKNEYNGAVGIYYPNNITKHKRYFSATGNGEFLLGKVTSSVLRFSNSQMIDNLYTWQGVNSALLSDRLESQRDERALAEEARKKAEAELLSLSKSLDDEKKKAIEHATNEANALLEVADEDIKSLKARVDELSKENEALRYENHGLKTKLDSNETQPVLYLGDEYEFYPGEIKDLLLTILSDSKKGIEPETRRWHIIEDIVSNNDYQNLCGEKTERIKKSMKNYDGISTKLEKELEDLGFTIDGDGKHYKLTYYGDGRYTFSFAKTPSDVHAGKNNAQTIIKKVF